MKTIANRSKLLSVAALLLLLIFAITLTTRVGAVPTCPNCRNLHYSFGMLGITSGQTARLSVVNAIPVGPPQIPVGPPNMPVRVDLMFVDENGNPITAGGQLLHTTVILSHGQSAFLDLVGDAIPVGPPSIPGGPPNRIQFRALLPNCEHCNRGFVIPTLEVFDNATGKTSLLMPDTPALARDRDDD